VPDTREPTKLMMSVEPAEAASLANIEALRLVVSNLEKLGDRLDRIDERWTKRFDEQADVLGKVHTRLTRIESNRLDSTVKSIDERVGKLDDRVDALETERDKRDGATGVLAWIVKSPALGWLAGAAAAVWAVLHGR